MKRNRRTISDLRCSREFAKEDFKVFSQVMITLQTFISFFQMQKSGVKTLSIIDTISELAQNENEALVSMASLPVPTRPRLTRGGQPPPPTPPGAPAKVGVVLNGVRRRPDVHRRGQTPEWIREIFQHAKRGNKDKLVGHPS